MQLTYTLTQRDFFEAIIAIRNRKKWAKWIFRAIPPLVLISVVFLVVGSSHSQRSHLISNLLPMVALFLFWSYLLWGSPWFYARAQFLKQPSAQGPRTAAFDDNEVKWQWDGGSSVVQWKTYIRWIESNNQILLCSSPIQCGIVPKRAMNEEQLSELRRLLAQNIGPGLRP